jgi:hypothetical protein
LREYQLQQIIINKEEEEDLEDEPTEGMYFRIFLAMIFIHPDRCIRNAKAKNANQSQ